MGRSVKSEYEVKKATVPNGDKVWYIIGRPNGKRIRAWFKSKEAAVAEATERNNVLRRLGQDVASLDAILAAMATDGATRLRPFGKTVKDAVDFYLNHLNRLSVSIPVTELSERILLEFERRRCANEISAKHHLSMRETMRKFVAQYGQRQVATITGPEIKNWLASLPLAVKTRNRHFAYIRNAFGIVTREWHVLDKNPLENLEAFRRKNNTKVEILTPEEMTKFLVAVNRDWLPFFAISAFTGLRREEVSRLDWSEVKLDRGLIDLPAEKSKNHRRKLEEVPANLLTILSPFVKAEGPVMPSKNLQRAMESAYTKAGIAWKQNCLRHSFCSYGVATRGLEWTADQADHDIRMLKQHYKEVVTKEAAAAYWAIVA